MKDVIEHKHFVDAEEELRDVLANHRPGRLVGICGLSGSGKTVLRNRVMRDVLGDPAKWGRGKLAAVEVMALLDSNSKYSPKGFAARSHRALMRPDLRALYRDTDVEIQKAYLEALRLAEDAWRGTTSRASTSETDYWRAFIEAAIDRELKYLLIEHAHAFGRLRPGEEPPDHMQNLMSVVEAIGAMAVLNFVPEGYKLWAGNPEIADRMDRIYIRPYDPMDPEQLTEFAMVVSRIAKSYKFESPEVYQSLVIETAISTGTSIRSLEKHFDNSVAAARRRGGDAITSADLRASFGTAEHVQTVWETIRLLEEISRPSTTDDLLRIHKDYLEKQKRQ